MSEKPILFSGPMVRAILDGKKTMTRRVMKPQPTRSGPYSENYARWRHVWLWDTESWGDGEAPPKSLIEHCPYGSPGQRLWVRETWWGWGHFEETGNLTETGEPELTFVWDQDNETLAYALDYPDGPDYEPDRMTPDNRDGWHKRPSIFMPRWASRLALEITAVKVERVQDISEADAIAEGVDFIPQAPAALNHRTAFAGLWQSINGKRPGCAYDANPWVWAESFKRVTEVSR